MICHIYILLAVCLICTLETKAKNNDAVSSALSPQQTLEALEEELSSLYIRRDEASRNQLVRLKGLMTGIKLNNCSPACFSSLNSWIEDKSVRTVTKKQDIVNLLKYNRQKLFQKCNFKLQSNLENAVDKIPEGERRIANELAHAVVSANQGKLVFTDSELAKGVAAYLKQVKKAPSHFVARKRYWLALHKMWGSMERVVLEPCWSVNDKLGDNAAVYSGLVRDSKIETELTDFEKNWELAGRVCASIIRLDRDGQIESVYKAL